MHRQIACLFVLCTALATAFATPALGQSGSFAAGPTKQLQAETPEQNASPLSGAEVGACCLEDGSCIGPVMISNCNVVGGFFQGINTTCADIVCAGACCLGNGACIVGPADDCETAGGTWEGYGTDCSCVTCNTGACCLPTGDPGVSTCSEATRATCESFGGLYMGGGTNCGGLSLCEMQVDGFTLQLAPASTTLFFDQFDPQSNSGGPTRVLEKVILFAENSVGLWAQVENASKIPISNSFMTLIVDESLDFRDDMSLNFSFNQQYLPGLLAPVDGSPNQGPDFHNFGHLNLCAFGIEERVLPADDLTPFIGLGTLDAEFNAAGLIGFFASTDFTFFFEDFFASGEVRIAYLYREIGGACCLCNGTCFDSLTFEACNTLAMTQTGQPPVSFTPGADCSDVDCEPVGACCLCTGECIENITQANCHANPNFRAFYACMSCADIDCDPVGACCLCTGECIENITQANCHANPNFRAFYACMSCADIDCDPVGACCLTTGDCLDNLRQQDCEAHPDFRSFYSCSECVDLIDCEATRACCLEDNTCVEVTPDICLADGGIVYPEGVFCDSVDCDPEPETCCEFGKPSLIVMQYTGEDCSATMHSQDSNHVNCEGDPAFAPVVRILATNHEDLDRHNIRVWFDGEVSLNETFDIDAAFAGKPRLGAKTFLHIYDLNDELLQLIEFHSSCSQPLNTGDQFGSALLIDCSVDGGGGGDDDLCDAGKPRALEMTYTGDDCSATHHSQADNKVNCDGDPMMMPVVRILATDKANPDDTHAKVWFDDMVVLNTAFWIDAANANQTKLKSRTYVYIYSLDDTLLQSIEFHTSCSQPLFVDDQFGSVRLETFIAEDD